jgi:hypothetical protein
VDNSAAGSFGVSLSHEQSSRCFSGHLVLGMKPRGQRTGSSGDHH